MFTFVIMLVMLIIIFVILGTLVYSRGNNKRWVAVGQGDVGLAISLDGKDWEGIEGIFDDGGVGYDVYRGGGRFVAVGDDTDEVNVWYSDNGEDWEGVEGMFGSGEARSVYYSGGVWAVTGIDEAGDGVIWWSYDGENWEEVEEFAFVASGLVVQKTGGAWLAGGKKDGSDGELIAISDGEDGTNWEVPDTPPESGDDAYINVFYSYDIPQDSYILAGGYGGGTGNNIWYSTNNGLDWNTAQGEPFGALGNVVKFTYVKGKYYAFGDDGTDKLIYVSDDGISWTEVTLPDSVTETSALEDIVNVNDEIYAVGQISDKGGYLVGTLSDQDLIWTQGEDSIFANINTFHDIIKHPSTPFVLGGTSSEDASSIMYSDSGDSNSWEEVEDNPFGDESSVRKIVYA
ncbi:MAG: hypothetical protein S4CHLAM20_05140 [Chlamydiia bacterium]|nr:hypothetical protein [Chlamydiia bacterium]